MSLDRADLTHDEREPFRYGGLGVGCVKVRAKGIEISLGGVFLQSSRAIVFTGGATNKRLLNFWNTGLVFSPGLSLY